MKEAQFALHEEFEERHWWFLGRRRILRQIVRAYAAPSPDTVIIDVGCGTGGNIGSLADEYATVGIAPSSQAIASAKKRFPRTEFICGIAPQDLAERMKTAKLLLLTDVLEHVEDDRALLNQLIAALSPGVGILLTVPADMSLWSQHDESFGHFRRYDHASLSLLWKGLPVSVRLVSAFNTRLYPVIKSARFFSRIKGSALGSCGTDFRMPLRPVNMTLERIFAGEGHRLTALLRGESHRPLRYGASLIALLEVTKEHAVSLPVS